MSFSMQGNKYDTDNSDLLIEIIRVIESGKDYFTAIVRLKNKKNGIFYEANTQTIYYENIKHWKLVESGHRKTH